MRREKRACRDRAFCNHLITLLHCTVGLSKKKGSLKKELFFFPRSDVLIHILVVKQTNMKGKTMKYNLLQLLTEILRLPERNQQWERATQARQGRLPLLKCSFPPFPLSVYIWFEWYVIKLLICAGHLAWFRLVFRDFIWGRGWRLMIL